MNTNQKKFIDGIKNAKRIFKILIACAKQVIIFHHVILWG
ncbi:hypothetical protein HPOKI673_04425 [Helicobacter pylori oki673]|nr:hypothetical protein HPOKI673_04425 [Helicobacter pylori oki673]AHN44158.1 hypothetical protein HPOKI828_04435 [Helicobacter pylori oki828]